MAEVGWVRGPGVGRPRILWGCAVAVAGTALGSAVLSLPGLNGLAVQTLLMLTVVVAAALVGGLWPAVAAALLSGLALNVLFIDPTGTVKIADPQNALALAAFLGIGIAVALVVDRSARLGREAGRARREADDLAELSRRLLQDDRDAVGVLRQAAAGLRLPAVAVRLRDPDGGEVLAAVVGEPLAAGPPTAVTRIEDGVELVAYGRRFGPADRTLFTAYASHLQVLRERERATERARQATELAEGNRIRTALLAAVSHDLRTPIAAVKAAASSLRSGDVTWSPADEAELLATVEDGADRLEHLVANLLDLTRLQTGAVHPLRGELDLRAAVEEAVRPLEGGARVGVEVAPGVLVEADAGLVDRVLANLVENALRHGAPPVTVSAEQAAGATRLFVTDHGPGLAGEERDRMFQPFQRLGDAPDGAGLGLGLAVAAGLTEAMGGILTASATPGGGLTMTLTLPGPESS